MTKNVDRVVLMRCVGKICAYIAVGKQEDAKQWAQRLVEHLKKMGLVS